MTANVPASTGRFGAATPGVRPSPPSLEALLAAPQPPPGRGRWSRRRVLMATVIVAVAAAAYVAGHLTWPHAAAPRPTELVVTATALPAGTRLTGADLRTVSVQPGTARPAGAMTLAAAAGMAGLVTARALPAGTFLERSLMSPAGALPNGGHALVGLALKPGQLPVGGLSVGQQVLVVMLRASSSGAVLPPVPLVVTTVWDLQGPDSSGDTLATVVIPARKAALLSGYAAQGEVALVATATATTSPAAAPASSLPAPASSPPAPARPSHQPTRAKKAGR